jgi:hypothetical protein
MMKKKLSIFAVLLLVSLMLAACSGSPTANFENTPAVTLKPVTGNATAASGNAPAKTITTNEPTPAPAKTEDANPTTTGLTMKQAFSLAEPEAKKWQGDVVFVRVLNGEDVGINPDGRSLVWFFQAVSVKLGKRGTWQVKTESGKANVTQSGNEELPTDILKALSTQGLPPVSTLIDSSELMNVAKQNGGDKSDRPVGISLAMPAREGDPLAFNLVFYQGTKITPLRIDALTGKVLDIARG